jgi:hypothetical protein
VPQNKREECFEESDLKQVADDLAMLTFYQSDNRDAVIALLARICPHKRALYWLRDELIDHVGKWPGPADVRGLLCTRFDPADGVDQWCSLPGYRAEDAEARVLSEHEQQKIQEKVGGYLADEPRKIVNRLLRAGK